MTSQVLNTIAIIAYKLFENLSIEEIDKCFVDFQTKGYLFYLTKLKHMNLTKMRKIKKEQLNIELENSKADLSSAIQTVTLYQKISIMI